MIGKLRHPGALVRLIDAERANNQIDPVPFDTVFGYEEPEPFDYEVRPRRRVTIRPLNDVEESPSTVTL